MLLHVFCWKLYRPIQDGCVGVAAVRGKTVS